MEWRGLERRGRERNGEERKGEDWKGYIDNLFGDKTNEKI